MSPHRAWTCTLLAMLLALAASCSGAPPDDVADARPNVILVLLDTLRADHLDLYGYPRETAPFLHQLGRRSVVFHDAVSSSSWTAPATASLLTGENPVRHGVTLGWHAHRNAVRRLEQEGRASLPINRISSALPTLAERLAERGYATFGVASNVNIGSEMGFDRGFDRFELRSQAPAETLLRVLMDWRHAIQRSGPWFVYIHLNDAHSPYVAKEPWYEPAEDERDDVRARYDSEIRYMDEELRRTLEALDPEWQAVVVVAADHGEEFWERGALGHFLSLHRELTRILLMVRAPGIAPRRVERRVGIVDVAPTLLELVDAAAGSEGAVRFADGRSLLPLLREGEDPAERTFFAHRVSFRDLRRQLWSATRGRFKLIEGDAPSLLFDVEADPDELSDLFAERPEVAAELSAEIARYRAIPSASGDEVEVTLDEEKLEQLRSLGYVGD